IYKKLNVPIKVMFPTKIMNKQLFAAAVPVMLMVAALGSLVEGVFEIALRELNISNVSWVQLPKDKGALVYYIIVGVIIAPCCSELFSRGLVMQLMRQFGDGTAVVFSAFITAAACFNLERFCYSFLISLVAGYFTIRTGSVITAVIMRVTASAFAHGLYILDEYFDERYEGMVIMLCILAALLIGIGVLAAFMIKHSDKLGMPLLTRYMTFSQKVTAMFTNVNMVIWLSTVIIMTLFNIRILL
ncbi:MAG: lysostaphin resistance A-like protein, partial [Huintestinicola sp.]